MIYVPLDVDLDDLYVLLDDFNIFLIFMRCAGYKEIECLRRKVDDERNLFKLE